MADATDREAGSGPALLGVPAEGGPRFQEEWSEITKRIRAVHAARVSHEIEPAGTPRLANPA